MIYQAPGALHGDFNPRGNPGVIGLVSLPIEQYPNIAPPTIMVRAAYTGANAETV